MFGSSRKSSSSTSRPEKPPPTVRSMSHFLKKRFSKGTDILIEKGKDELLKGKAAIDHSLGLGYKPNVIPPAAPRFNDRPRTVEIGWHPVGGAAGKWFAEQTSIGNLITKKINKYPDPTQHWAVLVGDYAHELWMDEKLDVIYVNQRIDRSEWHTFEVGTTRFNDQALREASMMVIYNMRQQRPAYNLISNNCQHFALILLDAIQVGSHKDFATTFTVYQTAVGEGKIVDLFNDSNQPNHQQQQQATIQRQKTVRLAKKVMKDNTAVVDNRHYNNYQSSYS